MRRIRAISLHQPWASYIADGHKTIETRTWETSCRGDILIDEKAAVKGISGRHGPCDSRALRGKTYAAEGRRPCNAPLRAGPMDLAVKECQEARPAFCCPGISGNF